MDERQQQLLEAYFAGQITDSQRLEIISLLEKDRNFAIAFKELEQANALAYIPAFETTKEEDYKKVCSHIEAAHRYSPAWKYFSLAAFASALILGTALLFQHSALVGNEQLQAISITSGSGAGTEAVLPDGSHVRLNAQSSLRLGPDFGNSSRDVILQGEGFFEVAKNPDKPFRVHSANACVTVKGTTFNVRGYEDEPEITVSLLEGSVVLNTSLTQAELVPGDCAVIARNDNNIILGHANPEAYAWIRGKYVFSDKSIPEILRAVERNHGVHFVYDNSIFDDERFTGNFSFNLSIDEIISYLDVDRKYGWTRIDNNIEIYKR